LPSYRNQRGNNHAGSPKQDALKPLQSGINAKVALSAYGLVGIQTPLHLVNLRHLEPPKNHNVYPAGGTKFVPSQPQPMLTGTPSGTTSMR
jgi:hypothetical protein